MIVMAAAVALILQTPQDEKIRMKAITLARPGEKVPSIMIQSRQDPMDPGAKSPKKFGVEKLPWEFPWYTGAFAYYPQDGKYHLRFRIFSQDHSEERQERVARMFATLHHEALRRLRYEHAEKYNEGIVDVYLCWGGAAGGEQRFDIVYDKTLAINVNTIYFYDIASFNDPMEMAREIAHEYGHAALPPIGGYKEPEGWANGYLGEKLYLKWMRDRIAAGQLAPEDCAGVGKEQLDAWIASNVDPLVLAASAEIPSQSALANPSKAGMDRYLGLAMYAATILPDQVFGRSMFLTGSTDAKDYPAALLLATEEPDSYTVTIPKLLANKPIWLPLGKGKVTGGKILEFRNGWTKLQAPEGALSVKNR